MAATRTPPGQSRTPATRPRAGTTTSPVARPRSARVDLPRVHTNVLKWFVEHGRSFPWREHRDPYKTLVAEVMLQQTQTGRVVPSYLEFLHRFPTVDRLARAPAMDVIRAWKGLGYNRRAVDLQRAAQTVESRYGGRFPSDPATLDALPGVGTYTATAVACFAFDAQIPVVDVNIWRVLARTVAGKDPSAVPKSKIDAAAAAWLPVGDAYEWNQALMDIGAIVCRIEQPLCDRCPLNDVCRYRAAGKDLRPAARRPSKEPFKGSRREKRGSIIDALRDSAAKGIALSELARALHPEGGDRNHDWLVELLEGLERDGLVTMTPSARRGSPRGLVRLPR